MVAVIIEPFYGGSHKQLIDFLTTECLENIEFELHTLPAKKWHWRARTSALYFAQNISRAFLKTDILFCSSVLNLAEFIALRPDVCECKKIVYFHENQLVYPVKKSKEERDFQYGYNQILTALTATQVLFNSEFNKNSFLEAIPSFMKLQPDFRPSSLVLQDRIASKSAVFYFPVNLPEHRDLKSAELSHHSTTQVSRVERPASKPLHIVWPHRWEHDKNPGTFLQILFRLQDEENLNFEVSILGQKFEEAPKIFDEAKARLGPKVVHFGPLEKREDYFEVLRSADVVVSTAFHEFFGVAVIEAAASGCFPLVPNRLVYPEIYPELCIYNTDQQLFKKIRDFCRKPHLVTNVWTREISDQICKKYSTAKLKDHFLQLFVV